LGQILVEIIFHLLVSIGWWDQLFFSCQAWFGGSVEEGLQMTELGIGTVFGC